MKPTYQTIDSDFENLLFGDCFSACISSILEIPLEEVPQYNNFFHLNSYKCINEISEFVKDYKNRKNYSFYNLNSINNDFDDYLNEWFLEKELYIVYKLLKENENPLLEMPNIYYILGTIIPEHSCFDFPPIGHSVVAFGSEIIFNPSKLSKWQCKDLIPYSACIFAKKEELNELLFSGWSHN